MPTEQDLFSQVPSVIRDTLGSEAAVDLFVNLNTALGIPELDTTIPRIVFEIEIKKLEPSQLYAEIEKRLHVAPDAARRAGDDIFEQLLAPIATELASYGIQISRPAKPAISPQPFTPSVQEAPSSPVATSQPTITFSPLNLHTETTISPIAAPVDIPLFSAAPGEQEQASAVIPQPNQSARLELGFSPQSQKIEELFVKRETPAPQYVDYSTYPTNIPSNIDPTTITAGSNSEPSVDDQLPTPIPSAQDASEAQVQESDGLFGALMRKIAPWHYTRYNTKTSSSPEPSVPSSAQVINYSDTPPAPPAA